MKYRRLGGNQSAVSEIGFGAWGLGGDAYGPIDRQAAEATVQYAYERGINFFDTSDFYGDGASEEILGRALKRIRPKVIICSKVGMLKHRGFQMTQDFSSDHIRAGLVASLRRLQTDYVDLYLLHSPPLDVLEDGGSMATLEALKEEGKILEFGVSARSPQDARRAIERYGIRTVQANFNLIDHRALDDGLFNLARRENVGVIVRTPLGFGYLTGRMSGDETLTVMDHRAKWPREQLRRWADASKLFSPLATAARSRTLAQFALQFCLAYDAVSTVIPGMLDRGQVAENVAASRLAPLGAAEIEKVREIYLARQFFDPAVKTACER
jgi:aryl-alcohol dehydrogenase-like predicted oxidoreductase